MKHQELITTIRMALFDLGLKEISTNVFKDNTDILVMFNIETMIVSSKMIQVIIRYNDIMSTKIDSDVINIKTRGTTVQIWSNNIKIVDSAKVAD